MKKKIKLETTEGIFLGTGRGFGFVKSEEFEDDIFIKERDVLDAMHSDRVLVELKPKTKGGPGIHREGRIIRVTERNLKSVVGTVSMSKNFGFVIPDNNKIDDDFFVSKENLNGATEGSKVKILITSYPSKGKSPEGKVIEVLGHKDDPGVDILSIVEAFGVPYEFPVKVLNQGERCGISISEADTFGRVDYRNELTVTIDGEDTKDFDDAVSVSFDGLIYTLGVHIADVANYVQESSALDKEAYLRGTSIYLCDRVIPMLPHSLSNGICSLNENEDRLTLSCIMEINLKGEVVGHRIEESVICVNHRMTYNDVSSIIKREDANLCDKYSDILEMLDNMKNLALILKNVRRKRGSIDFDIPESKILLDENGFPICIKPYERNIATNIIEEFMLIANETVSSHYFWMEVPFLYRTHDNPAPDKLEKLCEFIKNYGFSLKGDKEDLHPKEIQKLLDSIEGTNEETLITRITLRSMMQAKYSAEPTGHFGLACKYYSHFTSPIRRYPDLFIHRIIKDDYRGRLDERKIRHYANIAEEVAKKCSENERRAVELERETDKLKKVQYMSKHVGEIFEGVISGVTSFGIFVELENTVEGMIRLSLLTDDNYIFDEKNVKLTGEYSHNEYTIGQRIRVCVNQTDEDLRTIAFLLMD